MSVPSARTAPTGRGLAVILVPMKSSLPPTFACKECGAIATELRDAWEVDRRDVRERMRQVAASSGRDLPQFGLDWIRSLIELPDDEMQALLTSHYPRVSTAKQRQAAHEAASGHTVKLHGWWALLGLDPGSLYFRK